MYQVIYYGNKQTADTAVEAIQEAKQMQEDYGRGTQSPTIAWGTIDECRALRAAQRSARTDFVDVPGDID